MANRRMFSLKIIDTDAFLEMPVSSQLLYFHLSMRADDDGFVSSPKKILKMVGTGEDDMKILIAKRFIIPFESGVCVIKDWKIHNYIQADRYQETHYLNEKSQLQENENGAYEIQYIQNVSKMDTQDRIELGKDRLGKDILADKPQDKIDVNKFISLFEPINPSYERLFSNKTQRGAMERLIKKWGEEKMEATIKALPEIIIKPYAPKITTPYDLERDFGKLITFYKQSQLKVADKKSRIIK